MKRLILLFFVLGIFPACVATEPVAVSPAVARAPDVAAARAFIREGLRDPEGARFRREEGFQTAQGDQIICGEYNATNGFGGYVGYAPYYARLRDGRVQIAHFGSSLGAIGCDRAREGSVNVATAE